ncbi:MAG: BamA/TamA family outer membrane protein [bacterium]
MRSILILVFILFISITSINRSEEADTTTTSGSGWIALPYIYYTPETEFAFGAGGFYYFRETDSLINQRASRINLSVTYTTKKQFLVELVPFLYLDNEKYYLEMNLSGGKFPYNFYGIGNNTSSDDEESYTNIFYKAQLNFQKKFTSHYRTGIYIDYMHSKLSEFTTGGVLEKETTTGSLGGTKLGAGIILSYDNRDNINYSSKGGFYDARIVVYDKIFGSDYNYILYKFDFRRFFSISENNVIAFQLFGNLISGEPSFENLSLLGGMYVMRGYYQGRFRDKNLLAAQTEYRLPLIWKVGLAGFLGVGEIAGSLSGFSMNELKYSAGIGLRFLMDADEKLNLRVDYGFGYNSSALYFTVGEAF